jgi:DNA modification methylase
MITWTNERRKLRDLIPWEHNPRQINKAEAERLGDSLEEFGQIQTIAIGPDNEILDGHQRKAVWSLLPQFGPDHEVDVRVSSRPLTDKERQKLVVFLHRGTKGDWDWDELANSFEVPELLEWGFDESELQLDWGSDATPDPGAQVDKAAELQEKWQVQRGQIWQVGRHRVMCGDSTCAEDVGRLMGGERAEMMFADPPYGVDYRGGHFHSGDVNIVRERAPLEGDRIDIYAQFAPLIPRFVDGPCYCWFASSVGKPVYDAILGAECEIHAMIIWHKTNATYAAMNAQYKQRHEPLLYFKPKGSTLRWCGPTDECTLWEMDRLPSNENHPTEKPPTLAARAIGNHTSKTVADWFIGSGSTLVACEQTNRIGYGMEIEPKYVAVTLERLVGMGLEARLVG